MKVYALNAESRPEGRLAAHALAHGKYMAEGPLPERNGPLNTIYSLADV